MQMGPYNFSLPIISLGCHHFQPSNLTIVSSHYSPSTSESLFNIKHRNLDKQGQSSRFHARTLKMGLLNASTAVRSFQTLLSPSTWFEWQVALRKTEGNERDGVTSVALSPTIGITSWEVKLPILYLVDGFHVYFDASIQSLHYVGPLQCFKHVVQHS